MQKTKDKKEKRKRKIHVNVLENDLGNGTKRESNPKNKILYYLSVSMACRMRRITVSFMITIYTFFESISVKVFDRVFQSWKWRWFWNQSSKIYHLSRIAAMENQRNSILRVQLNQAFIVMEIL